MAQIVIVGAGAAGLMAAGAAVRRGHTVTLLEHAPRPAQKILVTGKGRCNLTNACGEEEFLRHVRTNPRFLYSSLHAFPPSATMDLFESLGVALKVERGRRVFPVSDKAAEVRQALLDYAAGASLVYDGAASLLLEPLETEPPPGKKKGPACRCVGVRGVSGRRYPADCVLMATGGVSYPGTGSTGDGYKLARQAGHTIVEPVPSLVSLVSSDPDCKKMMGLALKNVVLTLYEDDKAIFSEQGEMLFTHFGISGPLTLSASSHLGRPEKAPLPGRDRPETGPQRPAAVRPDHPGLRPAVQPCGPGRPRQAAARQYAAGDGPAVGHRPRHPRQPDHPGTKAGAGAPVQALGGAHRRAGRPGPCRHHGGGRAGAGGGPPDHGQQKGRRAVFCRRGAGCGRLYRRVQSADRLLHGPGVRGPSGTGYQRRKCCSMISVAIDGPAGAGKSTLARQLARDLGYIYVDTGAMYRAVGLYALRAGIDPADQAGVEALLPGIRLRLAVLDGQQHIYLNEEDVSGLIRTEQVGMAASAVGANPAVRAFLLDLQRDMARTGNVLMDGRDIGTVILPDATVKIFLTASPEARARRRWLEYQAAGRPDRYEEVLADVKQRDEQDSGRAAAPLRRAADAVLLDTSAMDLAQSLAAMKQIIKERVGE